MFTELCAASTDFFPDRVVGKVTTGSSFTIVEDDHRWRQQVADKAEDKIFDEVALSITDFERYAWLLAMFSSILQLDMTQEECRT